MRLEFEKTKSGLLKAQNEVKKTGIEKRAQLVASWAASMKDSVLGEYATGAPFTLIWMVLLSLASEGIDGFTTDNEKASTFRKHPPLGVDLIDFSKVLPKSRQRINWSSDWDEVFSMLLQLDELQQILKLHCPTVDAAIALAHNVGYTKRSGRELGRYFVTYNNGVNMVTRPVYTYSIIPMQVTGVLRKKGTIGYLENDIKRAFSNLGIAPELAAFLAFVLGNSVCIPMGGPIGWAPLPGLWLTAASLLQQLFTTEEMVADFESELNTLATGFVVPTEIEEVISLIQKLRTDS